MKYTWQVAVRAARRRKPVGPSADPEHNYVGLWVTKKIKIIFFGLAAGAATLKESSQFTAL